MKKISLFIFVSICVLVAGCTTKEQDEKIKTFWFGQLFNLMLRTSSHKQPMPIPLPRSFAQSAANPTQLAVPSATDVLPHQAPAADVLIGEDALPGHAPYEDRLRMKQDWASLQAENQQTLQDLQAIFDDTVKGKAFYIMLNTEQKLKQAAYSADNYEAYVIRQEDLVQEQNQALSKLMEQNKNNLRP